MLFILFFISSAAAMDESFFNDHLGFENKWRQVTVRYRKDSDHIRFTYANDRAWKTLSENKTDYPDGAIFSKIGIHGMEDPNFPNSVMPGVVNGILFMIKDAKKFKTTGGWGFQIYTRHGTIITREGEGKKQQACFACHQIVEKNGYVFSQPLKLFNKKSRNYDVDVSPRLFGNVSFIDKEKNELPNWLQKKFNAQVKRVRFIDSNLRTYHFHGTFWEIKPVLLKEAHSTGLPALLLTEDEKDVVMVAPRTLVNKKDANTVCAGTDLKFVAFQTPVYGDDRAVQPIQCLNY